MPAPLDLRTDFTPAQLLAYADNLTNRAHARRIRAIAAVLQGHTRTEAARIGGMERQTLRDWVHRFNTEGPDGLRNLRSPGRPPKLGKDQQAVLADLIARGPDPKTNGARRWRLSDVVRLIRERFNVEHDEVSVGRIMKRLGYVYNGVEWRPSLGAQSDPDTELPTKPRETASHSGHPEGLQLIC